MLLSMAVQSIVSQSLWIWLISKLLFDFLDCNQSTMIRNFQRTSNFVKGFVCWIFGRHLFRAKHLIWIKLLFLLFVCLWIGRISPNTFNGDVLSFLSGLLFLLKVWEVNLLELLFKRSHLWRSLVCDRRWLL